MAVVRENYQGKEIVLDTEVRDNLLSQLKSIFPVDDLNVLDYANILAAYLYKGDGRSIDLMFDGLTIVLDEKRGQAPFLAPFLDMFFTSTNNSLLTHCIF